MLTSKHILEGRILHHMIINSTKVHSFIIVFCTIFKIGGTFSRCQLKPGPGYQVSLNIIWRYHQIKDCAKHCFKNGCTFYKYLLNLNLCSKWFCSELHKLNRYGVDKSRQNCRGKPFQMFQVLEVRNLFIDFKLNADTLSEFSCCNL